MKKFVRDCLVRVGLGALVLICAPIFFAISVACLPFILLGMIGDTALYAFGKDEKSKIKGRDLHVKKR